MSNFRRLVCPKCTSFNTFPYGMWDEDQQCNDCWYIWEVEDSEV
jgi:hypothetical protein